jgi:hypothetical protein
MSHCLVKQEFIYLNSTPGITETLELQYTLNQLYIFSGHRNLYVLPTNRLLVFSVCYKINEEQFCSCSLKTTITQVWVYRLWETCNITLHKNCNSTK